MRPYRLALLPACALAAATALLAPCALAQSTDVVGGTPAAAGAWPATVSIVQKGETNNLRAHDCGGSLISPRHVLTAAHCIEDYPGTSLGRYRQVLVGAINLTTGEGKRYDIASGVRHPLHKLRGYPYDVAVLTLTEAVTDVKPVPFITNLQQEGKIAAPGMRLTVTGWGYTKEPRPFASVSKVLMQADMPAISNAQCKTDYGSLYDSLIDDTMLCTLEPGGGKDACNGDSGGPLYAPTKPGKPWVQVGVVSWGEGCARANAPGVFARLGTLGAWVKQQIATP